MSRRHLVLAAIVLAIVVVVVVYRTRSGGEARRQDSAFLTCVKRVAGSHPTENTIVWAKSQCAIDRRAFLP